jgi:hypothetical protein
MSLGWNFNMSFFPDGVLTNTDPNPIAKKVVDEIKTKFPKGDCVTYDTSIKNVQGFLPAIFLEKASGNYNVGLRQMKSGDSMAYITNYQQAYKDREFYINKMAEILPKYIQELEAEFNNKKCRDEFEKKRLQDMSSALTKNASIQEQSVLGKNFKEQYIYIGIGAGILLLGLYVVLKK